MSDLKEKLENITVARGASPNEEAIAREKMAKYTSYIKKEQPQKKVYIQEEVDPMALHEQIFRQTWYKLKAANRKRWNAY